MNLEQPGFRVLHLERRVVDPEAVVEHPRELERVLQERFDLTHTTLQVDHAGNGETIHLGTAERRIGPL